MSRHVGVPQRDTGARVHCILLVMRQFMCFISCIIMAHKLNEHNKMQFISSSFICYINVSKKISYIYIPQSLLYIGFELTNQGQPCMMYAVVSYRRFIMYVVI